MLRVYLRELEHAGLITCSRRGQGRSNLYVLHNVYRRAGETKHNATQVRDQTEAPTGTSAAIPNPEAADPPVGNVEIAVPEPHETAPDKERSEQHTDLDPSDFRTDSVRWATHTTLHPPDSIPPTPAARASVAGGVPEAHTGTRGTSQTTSPIQLGLDPAYQALVDPVRDLAEELGDGAPLRSTLTRAFNLLGRSGLTCREFLVRLEEARTITWTQRTRVTARSVDHAGQPRTNMLPYCFAVLERLLAAKAPRAYPPSTQHPHHADDPVAESNSLWRAVLEELRTIVAPSVFSRCRTARVVDQQANLLRVAVPNRLMLHWFDACLRRALDQALAGVGRDDVRIQFVL